MAEEPDIPLAPVLSEVLDKFLEANKADDTIDDSAAERLDALLRNGKTPKEHDLKVALFPPPPEDATDGIEGGDT